MKRAFLLVLPLWALLGAVALTGCKRADAGTAVSEINSVDTRLTIFTDPATGCQYLGVYAEAVTPRIAADGETHMGCKGGRQ